MRAFVIIFLSLFDALSTLVFVHHAIAEEFNPFMAWLLELGPLVFFFSKMLLTIIFVFLLHSYKKISPYAEIGLDICVTALFLISILHCYIWSSI